MPKFKGVLGNQIVSTALTNPGQHFLPYPIKGSFLHLGRDNSKPQYIDFSFLFWRCVIFGELLQPVLGDEYQIREFGALWQVDGTPCYFIS